MLHTSPDSRLRRIARLAKLPPDTPLNQDQVLIYAMLGPWSPYVGQLGAKEKPRPPIKRWEEHVRKACALASRYLGNKHRKLRLFKGFGRSPSLQRVLAMHGPVTGTIFPLQRATADNACQLENGWESTLAPTTNQVAPRMDFANVLWDTVMNKTLNPSKCKTTTARVNTILTAQHNVITVDELCQLVTVSKGYVTLQQFERLWRLCTRRVREQHNVSIPRRLMVPMPPLTDELKPQVQQFVRGVLHRSQLPRSVVRLLCAVVTCAPQAVTRVSDLLKGGRKLRAPRWVADRLKQACEWQAVQWDDRVIGYQVCSMTDHSRLQLLQTLRKKLASTPCRCADLMTEHPVLHNTLGHVICRDREQWEALIAGPAAAVLAGHARQAVIPSQADVTDCVDATCQAIAEISTTGGRTTTHASEQRDTPAVGQEEMAQERTKFLRICESHFQRLRATSAQLVRDYVEAMTSHLHDTGFRGGCWDKRLFKMYGTCFVVEEAHALEGLTLGGRFTIWGWGDSDRAAKLLALDVILERARNEGILSLAEGHNLGHPKH